MYPEISKEVFLYLNNILDRLQSVLCDDEEKVCMAGTQKDRDLVQAELDKLDRFLEAQCFNDVYSERTSSM